MGQYATCDLHMHTFYSDGRPSPRELVEHAAAIGLQTIAITDHDNTRGAREAIPLATQFGITVIPAIEFTCRWDRSAAPPGDPDVDVLGYYIDLDHPHFRAIEQATLADIHDRTAALCELLTAGGYPIALGDALGQNPRYAGTVQVIDALIAKGYAPDWAGALALIDKLRPQVRPSAFQIDQVIAAIHAAGGVAVLAHPTLIPAAAGWLQADELAELVDMGLDGVEIYHYRLDHPARAHFLALAQQFGLLISGGSDEHGRPTGFPRLASQPVTQAIVDALAARAAQHSHAHRAKIAIG